MVWLTAHKTPSVTSTPPSSSSRYDADPSPSVLRSAVMSLVLSATGPCNTIHVRAGRNNAVGRRKRARGYGETDHHAQCRSAAQRPRVCLRVSVVHSSLLSSSVCCLSIFGVASPRLTVSLLLRARLSLTAHLSLSHRCDTMIPVLLSQSLPRELGPVLSAARGHASLDLHHQFSPGLTWITLSLPAVLPPLRSRKDVGFSHPIDLTWLAPFCPYVQSRARPLQVAARASTVRPLLRSSPIVAPLSFPLGVPS